MLTIDGSLGEGGGQILRTSLALSLITQEPFRIEKIRARRDNPGLARQHLTAVHAAAAIGNATVTGAELRSTTLTFEPGEVKPGEYRFPIGTAGSTTLVLQTILPPLMLAKEPSILTLEGGTHNIKAPPFDFLQRTFLPLIRRLGPQVEIELESYGFYPAGGGRWTATIDPAQKLSRLDLPARGAITAKRARAVVVGLPRHIAERELTVVRQKLGWEDHELEIVEAPHRISRGNYLTLEFTSDHVTELFSAIAQLGIRAEQVAESAIDEARRYLDWNVPVGEHLADQLILPLALAGGGSFLTGPLTDHTTTNIEVVKRFLPVIIDPTPHAHGTLIRIESR